MKLVRRGAKAAVLVLGAIVLLAALAVGAYFGGKWLWGELAAYIHPGDATERKDVANIFVLIAVGVVGFLTASAAIVNLYFSRRNLETAQQSLRQQRDLDERRAQEDALQAYFEQMGGLLTGHNLTGTDRQDIRQLAEAQTFTVLARLDGPRKGLLVRFLHGARLINKGNPIVEISGADLRYANLRYADLSGADLSGANLSGADLSGADLKQTSLTGADLSRANLSVEMEDTGATLMYADLAEADLSGANMGQRIMAAATLTGAKLKGAKLRRAALQLADLRDTDLRDADLSGANISGEPAAHTFASRDFTVSILSGADLRGADLSNAIASNTDIEVLTQQAKSLEGATMPNGQKYEEWRKSKDRKHGETGGPS
jgi:uncharacterized protein YjbI with pentapeptide repeats